MCDPIGDPQSYLQIAEQNGMKVRFVVDTHVHADHVSAGRKLAELAAATYVLHASVAADYEFFPVNEGEV
ncbi:MAG TPA: MBL fold metallo-hydrolase, partial [Acidobacteriota bacterium]|nr:MBL fold metallo-hydrolase [Acidobacteriota bacterium]